MPEELRRGLPGVKADFASPAEVIEAALGALRAAGRPLARCELYRRLSSSGTRIHGTDPVKNVGTVLWRSGRFDNTGRRYWIAGEPRPAEKVDRA